MTKEWNHDVEATARMLLALAGCPEEKRSDTVAFVVKVWLEQPGYLVAIGKRQATHD